MYTADNNQEEANVIVNDETIWASQKEMARLFDVSVSTISRHLRNIFEEGELEEKVVVAKIANTTQHGAMTGKTQTQEVSYYNLDAIISVGYRVNSQKATRFRQWATNILKEYMIKGFVLDDDRLKQGERLFEKDYFQELLERVRSIRTSERRIWYKITDIFAEISVDYDKNSQITKDFYATVQNKFHYAITGKTGAEIIFEKADRNSKNMGLTTWKNSPDGRILKSDTQVAKNYLTEKEIKSLERNVSSYFDYIEDLIERRNSFTMEQFVASVDNFLNFREYRILEGKGSISMSHAKEKASREYVEFNKTQKINSDFEKQIKKLTENHS
ncbi:toxin Fic [Streptococcus uberis]|nr:toxin Fic [Streptococcus uberis]